MDYLKPDEYQIVEGWYYPEDNPSEYSGKTSLSIIVPNLYRERQKLKAAGNAAEYILKIGLNSLYGKFAQSVGSRRFRNICYAGYITSRTRAALYNALAGTRGGLQNVIGFATDGIFTTAPLDLPISKKLGGWSLERYRHSVFLMAGVYKLWNCRHTDINRCEFRPLGSSKENDPRKYCDDDNSKDANRGFGRLDWGKVLAGLNSNGRVQIEFNVFVTHKLAMAQYKAYGPYVCQFIKAYSDKILNPYNQDKRDYHIRQIKDWTKDSCGSRITDAGLGQISAQYIKPDEATDDLVFVSDLSWAIPPEIRAVVEFNIGDLGIDFDSLAV